MSGKKAAPKTQREWEEEMSQKVLELVHSEIYMELRFLETALLALKPKEIEGLEAFASDGNYLYFSSHQVLRVFQSNPKYLDRAYLHSVLHCIFAHLWIGGNREPYLWGIACDIAVEYVIDKMGKECTKRILSFRRQQMYQELEKESAVSAAVIYRQLHVRSGEEIEGLHQEFYTDDHRFWPKQEETRGMESPTRQKWNKIARQSQMEQKMRGEETKDGEEVFASQVKVQKSRRSYGDFLRKFSRLSEELQIDPEEFDLGCYTYGLQLYGNMPLIEPLESREVMNIREFVIVLDTSYSTSGELISNFLEETYGVLSHAGSFSKQTKIRILQCDDQVRREEIVTSKAELEALLNGFSIEGGGGTDFRPAFVFVNELLEKGIIQDLAGLLYFTDGKGIYPKKKPNYKTAFLFLGEYEEKVVPPWAMRLQLEPEEINGKRK